MKILNFHPLKNRTIREKLIFFIMLTTFISLFLVSITFFIYETLTYRQKVAEDLNKLATFVGSASKETLISKDKAAAKKILGSLVNQEHVQLAHIYDHEGRIFAKYGMKDAKDLGLLQEGSYYVDKRLHSYQAIVFDGGKIGTIYLQSDLRLLQNRLLLYGRILIVVMGCTFLVALQISSRLQKFISGPIHHLVTKARIISEKKDYTVRADKTTDDEIGNLTDAFNEMIQQIESAEKKLHYQAFHDSLTALPNRALLIERLERSIEQAKRYPEYKFAILYIDLDRFKLINDSLGHVKGDQLLKFLSERFKSHTRKVDTVARLGGDEFVILLEKIKHDKDTITVSERINKMLEEPFNLDGQKVYVNASIGITVNRKEYKTPTDFLRDSDSAMYYAKRSAKSSYRIFDLEMHKNAVKILELETDIRDALENNEFVIYYQPIISVKDKKMVAIEALLRWQHPKKGLILPMEFIPRAEETGLIIPIGHWLLENVCLQNKQWLNDGFQPIDIAVNFSAKQFEEADIEEFIRKLLSKTNNDASFLEIEITESAVMKNVKTIIRLMENLRKMGISITIDDFGTGFSSLSSLRNFPVNKLKIDRSFIHNLPENKENVAISKAIISMAHTLGFKVVGEGIETQAQFDMLEKLGCDEIQGYLFSKPIPEQELRKKLTKLKG